MATENVPDRLTTRCGQDHRIDDFVLLYGNPDVGQGFKHDFCAQETFSDEVGIGRRVSANDQIVTFRHWIDETVVDVDVQLHPGIFLHKRCCERTHARPREQGWNTDPQTAANLSIPCADLSTSCSKVSEKGRSPREQNTSIFGHLHLTATPLQQERSQTGSSWRMRRDIVALGTPVSRLAAFSPPCLATATNCDIASRSISYHFLDHYVPNPTLFVARMKH